MCHWRSQVPKTLVPINQPKKSQRHGKEYIKRIAMGSFFFFLKEDLYHKNQEDRNKEATTTRP